MNPRPIKLSIALILVTIAAGLAVRRMPLHLPPYFTKYAGSMLWALMIYWIVSTLAPRLRLANAAIYSATIATAVEVFKLYHLPTLDAFRLTPLGSLLLGRIFSLYDLAAYYLAIAIGVAIDSRLRTANPATRRN